MLDDLAYVNGTPEGVIRHWVALRPGEWDEIEARVRPRFRVREDFITIPFPRLASASDRQIAAAVDSYKREAAIVDPRLSREVDCAFKAMALSDLCERLRPETRIDLKAGASVADEKVTLLCEKTPLRDVMRQLSRPFGYAWLRSKKDGEYRYELVQDLRSQLLEEELRNRDRNAALLALDRDMERYRPYLSLSPDEALARAKSAAPEDQKLLETLGRAGWGPIHMYFRLSPQQQAALRSGQELKFSQDPQPGEERLLDEIARGVLQARRNLRIIREKREKDPKDASGQQGSGEQLRVARRDEEGGVPPSAVPEARAAVTLKLSQTELGRFGFSGSSEVHFSGWSNGDDNGPYALGLSPAALQPQNAAVNARLSADPTLRRHITIEPRPSCGTDLSPSPSPARGGEPQHAGARVQNQPTPPSLAGKGVGGLGPEATPTPGPRATSADALEALHRASGMPIVADFYTRLYPPESVTLHDQPLFGALNQLADALRLRWNKDGSWLQFRSISFYNDRLKEVPNRLLARWAAARREHGALMLDDLIEIAGLPEAALDARDMSDGARQCWGLAEWDLACNEALRPHLRWITSFTPIERQKLQGTAGLRFPELSLPQQQRFIALATGDPVQPFGAIPGAIDSLAELETATMQVDYSLPGAFEWKAPEKQGGPPAPLAPVRAPTREAALAAARRLDPQADLTQIELTALGLTLLYRWGTPQANGVYRINTHRRGDTSTNRGRTRSGP